MHDCSYELWQNSAYIQVSWHKKKSLSALIYSIQGNVYNVAFDCSWPVTGPFVFRANSISTFTPHHSNFFCTRPEIEYQAICWQFSSEFPGCYHHLLCNNPFEFCHQSRGGTMAKRDALCFHTAVLGYVTAGIRQLPACNVAFCWHIQQWYWPDFASLFHAGWGGRVLFASFAPHLQRMDVVQYTNHHASSYSTLQYAGRRNTTTRHILQSIVVSIVSGIVSQHISPELSLLCYGGICQLRPLRL